MICVLSDENVGRTSFPIKAPTRGALMLDHLRDWFLFGFSWFSSSIERNMMNHVHFVPRLFRNIINYVPTKEYGIISFDVRLSEREA